MQTTTEINKAIVNRFNKEFIEDGNDAIFKELIAEDVINHSAPEGTSQGPEGMYHFLQNILKKGFPDLKVDILAQIAEGDMVTSRKILSGTHSGNFMDIAPSHKKVKINVIDIIRLENGQYKEHWGISDLAEVCGQLTSK